MPITTKTDKKAPIPPKVFDPEGINRFLSKKDFVKQRAEENAQKSAVEEFKKERDEKLAKQKKDTVSDISKQISSAKKEIDKLKAEDKPDEVKIKELENKLGELVQIVQDSQGESEGVKKAKKMVAEQKAKLARRASVKTKK